MSPLWMADPPREGDCDVDSDSGPDFCVHDGDARGFPGLIVRERAGS